jgi:predicted dehydrogenase
MSGARPVRWGFLGAGYVASRALAPAVHAADGAVLQVVGARDPARAAALEPQRTTASYEAVCTADDVDVVYVALPNNDHLPWVLRALAAGKHVLCEKPLGLDAGEAAVMVEEATRAGRLLVEAAWNRWHPRTRRAEALLAGATGRRTVRASFTFSGVPAGNYRLDPARGGGALLDVGCYVVASALAALGPGEVSVAGAERRLGPTGVDLTTSAVLAHPNGSAEVTASLERPEAQVLQVDADGMSLELLGQAFTTWREPCGLRVVEAGVEREETFPSCDAYALMVEAVSERSSGQDAWVLPLSTSAGVAATLDAITRAADGQ